MYHPRYNPWSWRCITPRSSPSSGLEWRCKDPGPCLLNPVSCTPVSERVFFDNLLVRIHLIIEMTGRTGLASWEFEFPFSGSRIYTFLVYPEPSLLNPVTHAASDK